MGMRTRDHILLVTPPASPGCLRAFSFSFSLPRSPSSFFRFPPFPPTSSLFCPFQCEQQGRAVMITHILVAVSALYLWTRFLTQELIPQNNLTTCSLGAQEAPSGAGTQRMPACPPPNASVLLLSTGHTHALGPTPALEPVPY